MSEKFKIGDVVSLHSERKTMTVTNVFDGPEAMVQCDWFDDHGVHGQASFHEATLCRRSGVQSGS